MAGNYHTGGLFGSGDYAYADGEVPVWSDALQRYVPGSAGGGGITELTGDVTAGPGSGSQAATLANTAVTPGTYGDGANIPQITVDSKGRITAASEVAISGSGTLHTVTFVFGDGVNVIPAGTAVNIPYWPFPDGTIIAATLIAADGANVDIAIDVFMDAAPSIPSTSIVAAAPPTLSTAQYSRDTTLTGWTTGVSTGDSFGAEVLASPTPTATRVTLVLTIRED